MRFAVPLFILLASIAPRLFAQAPLRAGEIVEIRIAGVPLDEIQQFAGAYQIDDGGQLNVPYIGAVGALGLTASDLQEAIESKLKRDGIYTHPTITVLIPNNTRYVNIGGSVRQPGRVLFTPDLTLMSAINAAGGLNDFARNIAYLTRGGQRTKYDLKRLRKDPKSNPQVLPGDQIEVPQSIW